MPGSNTNSSLNSLYYIKTMKCRGNSSFGVNALSKDTSI